MVHKLASSGGRLPKAKRMPTIAAEDEDFWGFAGYGMAAI
jgi:hypothetical protein